MSTSIGALRRPLQGVLKGIPSRLQLETPPHANFGALRRFPRQSSQPRVITTSLSAFSTRSTCLDHTTQSQRKSDPNYWGSKPLGTPLAMSFESLGVRKNTQLLVMLILTVGAFLEALLWGEKAWIWWKGEEGDRLDTA